MGSQLSKVVRVKYERGVLRLLEPVDLREGEEIRVRIERSVRERLRDLISYTGRV